MPRRIRGLLEQIILVNRDVAIGKGAVLCLSIRRKLMLPADCERAGTWIIEIAEALLENVEWVQEGDELRASGHGGLTINTRKGCWHQHSTGAGGWTATSLVAHRKDCDTAAATAWVAAWLASHPGTGQLIPADDDDD